MSRGRVSGGANQNNVACRVALDRLVSAEQQDAVFAENVARDPNTLVGLVAGERGDRRGDENWNDE